ncbi:uncharacterized protein LOC142235795 [Haematobia irritans]|uniref:uncharacterized protein LOC142235795 n=1 Tax=Haematobia irritans TaxID=7368 RepID=UPI003F505558
MKYEDLLKNQHKPVMIVTKFSDINLDAADPLVTTQVIYENFSHNFMVIVIVDHQYAISTTSTSCIHNDVKSHNEFSEVRFIQSFENMANITKSHLRKLHYSHILWIVKNASMHELSGFSDICWSFGFTKVLFYTGTSLYTYNKFPTMKVIMVSSLKSYYTKEEMRNFHQYPIKFPISSSPPRCYRFIDKEGRTVYAGYMYNYLITFIRQFNFSFSEYPHNYNSDDEEVLTEALKEGKVDFLPFTTYPNRSYDTSLVLWQGRANIAVPHAQPIPVYHYLNKPYDFKTWLLFTLAIIGASFGVAGFVYMKYNRWDLSRSCLYVCSVTLYQSQIPIPIKSWRFRLFCIMLLVYSFIMINFYLCIMASFLVTNVYEHQITTFEELAATNLRFPITQLDLDTYRDSHWDSPALLSLCDIEDGLTIDELRRNLSTDVVLGGFHDKLKFYMFQQKHLKIPRVYLMPTAIYITPVYISARHNLPYSELFSRYVQYLWESGLLWKTFEDIEWFGILSGELKYLEDEKPQEPYLTLAFFYAPLTFYCTAVIISCFVFVLEVINFKYAKCENRLLNTFTEIIY